MLIFYSLKLNSLLIGNCRNEGRSKVKEAEFPWELRVKFGFTEQCNLGSVKGGHHFGFPGTEKYSRMQDFSVLRQGKSPGAGIVGHLRSESQMRYLKKHLPKHTVKKLFGSGDFKLYKAKQAEDICKYFLFFLFP